jgi:hypothetical protein
MHLRCLVGISLLAAAVVLAHIDSIIVARVFGRIVMVDLRFALCERLSRRNVWA